MQILENHCVWLSDLLQTNDHLEGRWISKVVQALCAENELSQTVVEKIIDYINYHNIVSRGAGFCMSEEGDLLSQWRAYAQDATGVSIGFNKGYLDTLSRHRMEEKTEWGFGVSKVEYSIEAQMTMIRENFSRMLEAIDQGALSVFGISISSKFSKDSAERANRRLLYESFMLLPYLFSFKNPAFNEEREWRLVAVFPYHGKSMAIFKHLDYRISGGRIVPYFNLELEALGLEPIAEVVIGPRNQTPSLVVEAALAKHGFGEVKVRRSDASYGSYAISDNVTRKLDSVTCKVGYRVE